MRRAWCVCLAVGLASTFMSRSGAQDREPVTFTPVNSASQFRLAEAGFAPITSDPVDGCDRASPWIPVASASHVWLFPAINVNWSGIIPPGQSSDRLLTTFQVEARSLDGAMRVHRLELRTRDLEMTAGSAEPDGSVKHQGTLATHDRAVRPLAYSFGVEQPSELRIKLCGVAEGASMVLRDLSLAVIPNI